MRSALAALVVVGMLAPAGRAADEPAIPPPAGFVTDRAHVVDAATAARVTGLVEELRAKTGAEIAVLTVDSTRPLDDFTYAMRVADAWKPGRKGEDTGVVLLLATGDHKLRVVVGYGLEGILPDGLVGEIEDREMLPALRAGRPAEAIERGVRALAGRIAAARGVTLTGVPPPVEDVAPPPPPAWLVLLVLLAIGIGLVVIARQPAYRRRMIFMPGGFGGGFGGSFGGGGGGFGGFGGGSFGGGGAGRSW
jgi:uncharacterized protein